jgi:hypothetical protein
MPAINVSPGQFKRFQAFAEPLLDTHETAFEKVLCLAEGKTKTTTSSAQTSNTGFNLHNMPSLKHTDLLGGTINGHPLNGKYWNNAVVQMLESAQHKVSLVEASKQLPVNISEQKKNDQGYTWYEQLGVSVQGLAAHEAAKSILLLAEKYEIPVELDFAWQNKAEAVKPGERGKLIGGA